MRFAILMFLASCAGRGDNALHELDICVVGVWDDVENRPVTSCEVGCAAGGSVE